MRVVFRENLNSDFVKVLSEFLSWREIKQALIKNDFYEIYRSFRLHFDAYTCVLTQLFYEAEVDPLLYMSDMPYNFLRINPNLISFITPNNLESIGE